MARAIACFDSWVMKIRLDSVAQQVARGDLIKAVDTIDDTIFQLDNCVSTDIAQPWRDDIWSMLSTAQCLILCGLVDDVLYTVLQDIDDALKQNERHLVHKRWAKAMTARLRRAAATPLPHGIMYALAN